MAINATPNHTTTLRTAGQRVALVCNNPFNGAPLTYPGTVAQDDAITSSLSKVVLDHLPDFVQHIDRANLRDEE